MPKRCGQHYSFVCSFQYSNDYFEHSCCIIESNMLASSLQRQLKCIRARPKQCILEVTWLPLLAVRLGYILLKMRPLLRFRCRTFFGESVPVTSVSALIQQRVRYFIAVSNVPNVEKYVHCPINLSTTWIVSRFQRCFKSNSANQEPHAGRMLELYIMPGLTACPK